MVKLKIDHKKNSEIFKHSERMNFINYFINKFELSFINISAGLNFTQFLLNFISDKQMKKAISFQFLNITSLNSGNSHQLKQKKTIEIHNMTSFLLDEI